MRICFEGISGTGKSTVQGIIKDWLLSKGKKVLTTSDPGGTLLADVIRPFARQVGGIKLDPLTQFFAFFTARSDLVKTLREAEKDYDVVLMDRWWLSTWVYQCMIGGVNKMLFTQAKEALNYEPTILLIFDCDPKIGLKRSKRTSSFEHLELQKQARQAYKNLEPDSGRFIINAERSLEEVVTEVKKIVETCMQNHESFVKCVRYSIESQA